MAAKHNILKGYTEDEIKFIDEDMHRLFFRKRTDYLSWLLNIRKQAVENKNQQKGDTNESK